MKTRLTSVIGTLMLTLLGVILSLVPQMAAMAEYDRGSVLSGQWWRILTCHFTHWNVDHLFWDLAVFAGLGALVEQRSRGIWLVTLTGSAVLIPLLLLATAPDVMAYRGLSGLDSALFALVILSWILESWRDRDWLAVAVLSTLSVGFVLKLSFEVVTGTTLFVDSARADFTPIVEAHVVGGLVGAATTAVRRLSNWQGSHCR